MIHRRMMLCLVLVANNKPRNFTKRSALFQCTLSTWSVVFVVVVVNCRLQPRHMFSVVSVCQCRVVDDDHMLVPEQPGTRWAPQCTGSVGAVASIADVKGLVSLPPFGWICTLVFVRQCVKFRRSSFEKDCFSLSKHVVDTRWDALTPSLPCSV